LQKEWPYQRLYCIVNRYYVTYYRYFQLITFLTSPHLSSSRPVAHKALIFLHVIFFRYTWFPSSAVHYRYQKVLWVHSDNVLPIRTKKTWTDLCLLWSLMR
jgi:hypothetical protein